MKRIVDISYVHFVQMCCQKRILKVQIAVTLLHSKVPYPEKMQTYLMVPCFPGLCFLNVSLFLLFEIGMGLAVRYVSSNAFL